MATLASVFWDKPATLLTMTTTAFPESQNQQQRPPEKRRVTLNPQRNKSEKKSGGDSKPYTEKRSHHFWYGNKDLSHTFPQQ